VSDCDEVVELERAGWRALATGGDAAADFYEAVLADPMLMLLPGGMELDDRSAAVEAMRGPPWDHYELGPVRTLALGADAVAVTYRATARRGDVEYDALFNSTYVRVDGRWRLALHQQTPV
jgi:hypothetical protein